MNQVYSRPRYYDASWQSWRSLLDAGVVRAEVELFPLERFIDFMNTLEWDENLVWLTNHLAKEQLYFTQHAQSLAHFLLHEKEECGVMLGYPEREEDTGKYGVLLEFSAFELSTKKEIPLVPSLRGYGLGQNALFASGKDGYFLETMREAHSDNYEQNLVQGFFAENALKAVMVPVAQLVSRLKKSQTGEGSMEMIARLAKEGNMEAGKAALTKKVREERAYTDLGNALVELHRLRMANILSLAGLCSDREGAFDWFCSVDGPAFTGPMAAELSIAMENVFPEGTPNLFEGISVASDEEKAE